MTAAVKGASRLQVKLMYCAAAVNDLDSCPQSEAIQTTLSPACVCEAQWPDVKIIHLSKYKREAVRKNKKSNFVFIRRVRKSKYVTIRGVVFYRVSASKSTMSTINTLCAPTMKCGYSCSPPVQRSSCVAIWLYGRWHVTTAGTAGPAWCDGRK